MKKGEANPQTSPWTKRLGWGVTVTFLVLWSFVLGILVGQGSIMSPKHLKAMQEFMGLGGEPEPQPLNLAETEDKTKMLFYKGTKGAAPPKLPPAKHVVQKPIPQPSTGWAVQVASFRERHIAESMVQQLQKDNLPAYSISAQVKNVGLRYRVRVGPYQDHDKANRIAELIRGQYNRAGLVVEQK